MLQRLPGPARNGDRKREKHKHELQTEAQKGIQVIQQQRTRRFVIVESTTPPPSPTTPADVAFNGRGTLAFDAVPGRIPLEKLRAMSCATGLTPKIFETDRIGCGRLPVSRQEETTVGESGCIEPHVPAFVRSAEGVALVCRPPAKIFRL